MYLELNTSVDQSIDLIKEKIKSNTPFSFSRFGDGEIHAFNRSFEPQFEMRGCREWGYQYPSQINVYYDDTKKVILNSLKYSDMIGLMDGDNDIFKGRNLNKQNWSFSKKSLNDNGIDTSKFLITDHMLPRSEKFGKIENFKEILQGKTLNIISPNTEKLKQKNLSKLLDADVTFTYQPNSINLRNRDEFIQNFKNIKSDVVLVGCGLQKDYVVYLRHNYGKVAIDVGALLDAWAGIQSRPWFQHGGKQNYLML
jgi:hypothetical protein